MNENKSEVVVLGEKGLVCEGIVDGRQLDYVSEFKYFEFVLDESGTGGLEFCRKAASGWKVADGVRRLVIVWRL